MPGRRPLPPDQVRSEKVWTRITKPGRDAFHAACAKAGVTPSKGLRQAVENWTKEQLR